MSKNVFILGAGSSRDAGAPLMGDFLDVAESLREHGHVSHGKEFDIVFKALSKLNLVHSKASLDFKNIESAYAAFEMGHLFGRMEGLSNQELEQLPSSMKAVICETLEQTVKFPISSRFVGYPAHHREFVSLVDKLGVSTTSVITFNYDLCFDYSFNKSGKIIKYGIPGSSAFNQNTIELLKLHGSLNWAKCSSCNQVIAWDLRDYSKKYKWEIYGDEGGDARLNLYTNLLNNFTHCDKPCADVFIAPPTWNKTSYYLDLRAVWAAAANALRDATNIYICGYSLPDSDNFFQYLYGIGSAGDSRLKRFYVYNPDPRVDARFVKLLGAGVKDRYRFFQYNFSQMIDHISSI